MPITEESRQSPINPYGASKLMVERMLSDFAQAYHMRFIALRYFNAAGADPDGEIGELHLPETHLIPLVLDAASGRRSNITIFGNDYATRDGTCIRDYIHVSDLADAHVKALQALDGGKESTAYNLGTGNGFSVREIVDCVERISGTSVPVVVGPRRAGDPEALVSDAAKAKAELDWRPRWSALDDIVGTAWAWHQKTVVPQQPVRSSSAGS
jgi:UDP-arabinose 4-epimerase